MMTSKWFCFEEAFIYAFMCYFIYLIFFQKRGIEGCVVSNESIGGSCCLSLGAYEVAFELALERSRSRLWVWHVAV